MPEILSDQFDLVRVTSHRAFKGNLIILIFRVNNSFRWFIFNREELIVFIPILYVIYDENLGSRVEI